MLKSYFRVALRILRRQMVYTSINVLGLTVGLTCCILIGVFIAHELSYDRFHEQADRIFRIAERYYEGGRLVEESASIPFPFGPTLADAYELKTVRLYHTYQKDPLIGRGEKRFYEPKFFFTDSTFFEIFSYPLLRGHPSNVLDEPFSVVLTESAARKYFGNADPIGQTIRFENALDFRVTGIAQDPPTNTHFHFEFLAALQNVGDIMAAEGNTSDWQGWFWNPCHTYVLLPPETSPEQFEAELTRFVQTHFPEWLRESVSYYLQPLPDIHLHSQLYQEIQPNGSHRTVQLFSAVALLILLIACINFMNLATARSLQRAKEVGMRKVLGAERRQLVGQFLGESMIVSVTATLLAAGLALLLRPAFAGVLGTNLPASFWLRPGFWLAVAGVAVLVGLAAGMYPAFVMSAHRPASILQGKASVRGRTTAWLRKSLVVTQFAISIALLISTAFVYRQLQHMQQKDLGFDREQMVVVPIRGTAIKENYEAFKQEILRHAGILHATAVSDVVGREVTVRSFGVEGVTEGEVPFPGLFADADFAETFGVRIVEGRDFDRNREADRDAVLLNSALIRQMGWEGEAVGKWLHFFRKRTVIGVTNDFNFEPVRRPVRALAILYDPEWFAYLAVRLAPGDPAPALQALEEAWTRFEPARPFEPFFLDEDLDRMYREEARLGQVFSTFSMLAILIACLGLFGLAAFQMERRMKEIGVRKALGASVGNLLLLLSKDFVKLVGVAFALAAPLVYVGLSRWLQDFAYRVELSWWIFLAAGLAAMVIAWLTVSYQVVRAAAVDPVRVLRYE